MERCPWCMCNEKNLVVHTILSFYMEELDLERRI